MEGNVITPKHSPPSRLFWKRISRPWRIVLLILLSVIIIGVVAAAVWLQPYSASSAAVAALRGTADVTVTQNNDMIAFVPHNQAHVGLIFYPGAKVDPVAYSVLMEQIAEKGFDTFIAKMPLNLALLNENAANTIISAYPNIHIWTVGGHSLGGVAACDYAAAHGNIKGVLLYASYPSKDISQDTGQDFTSIYGTRDGLATPAKINDNKKLLPPTTVYLPIQGGIHSYFGDYGHQDGDGQATISRQEAQSEIVADSVSFLNHVAALS